MNNFRIAGNYVAAQAAAHVRSKLRGSSTGNQYLNKLSAQYPDLEFSVGAKPFGRQGIGNVTIDPATLREIESNPKKRSEFEAMLKDCNQCAKESAIMGKSKIVSQGFLLDANGELQGWSVTKNSSGTQSRFLTPLDRERPSGWFNSMTTLLKVKERSSWQKKFQS